MTLFNFERRDVEYGAVHNPFENPAVPLSSVALDSAFGALSMTDAGESVTVDTALAIPTYWRCVNLLATVVAGCPLRTYKHPAKKELFPAILDPGNAAMLYTPFELWSLVMMHRKTWGFAAVLKVRNGADQIVDLRPVHPGRVTVKLDDGQKIFEVKQVNADGTLNNTRPPVIYTTFEIMHLPGLGYDGINGLAPVSLFARSLGTAIAGDRLAAKFFAKGSSLSGIIKIKAPLANQQQADEIRRRWIAKSGGVAHAAEVAVLDAETDFQPLTIPPDQLQFLESRRWSTTEIARMFGIPPHLVGDVEKSTSWGTGIEQQNVGFVSYTISQDTNAIEQRVSREVISTRGQFCEFDMNRLLRGSMSERYAAYGLAIQWGWLTRNEARHKENMQPIKGLDEPLTPLNMAAEQTDTEPLGTTTAPGNDNPDDNVPSEGDDDQ